MALKSGYNFATYSKFTNISWVEELQTRKPLSPFWAFSSISRKRQVMGFEPLCHKCDPWSKWVTCWQITFFNF